MATRTVRFDKETERVLSEVRAATDLPISEARIAGIADSYASRPSPLTYEIDATLDLGPGGYAIASSARSRVGVREDLARKHRR